MAVEKSAEQGGKDSVVSQVSVTHCLAAPTQDSLPHFQIQSENDKIKSSNSSGSQDDQIDSGDLTISLEDRIPNITKFKEEDVATEAEMRDQALVLFTHPKWLQRMNVLISGKDKPANAHQRQLLGLLKKLPQCMFCFKPVQHAGYLKHVASHLAERQAISS